MRTNQIAKLIMGLSLAMAMQAYSRNASASEIYRCISNGQVTLTDHVTASGNCEPVTQAPPNLADVDKREIKQLAHADRSAASARDKSGSQSIAEVQLAAKQRCARIDAQLDDLKTKMRLGYKLKEGEKLRERERALQEKRSIERCR